MRVGEKCATDVPQNQTAKKKQPALCKEGGTVLVALAKQPENKNTKPRRVSWLNQHGLSGHGGKRELHHPSLVRTPFTTVCAVADAHTHDIHTQAHTQDTHAQV